MVRVYRPILHGIPNPNTRNRIFIIEGLLTVIVGIIARFWVCDWPETANFLTEEERAMLTSRLQTDSGEAIMNRLDKAAGAFSLPSSPLSFPILLSSFLLFYSVLLIKNKPNASSPIGKSTPAS